LHYFKWLNLGTSLNLSCLLSTYIILYNMCLNRCCIVTLTSYSLLILLLLVLLWLSWSIWIILLNRRILLTILGHTIVFVFIFILFLFTTCCSCILLSLPLIIVLVFISRISSVLLFLRIRTIFRFLWYLEY